MTTDPTDITITFTPNTRTIPQGKLADAELHFTGGLLAGLRLVGFAVWERRDGGRNVTVPARSYAVNGERRSFALLRATDETAVQQGALMALREAVLQAYAAYEAHGGVPAAAPAEAPLEDRVNAKLAELAEALSARAAGEPQTDWSF